MVRPSGARRSSDARASSSSAPAPTFRVNIQATSAPMLKPVADSLIVEVPARANVAVSYGYASSKSTEVTTSCSSEKTLGPPPTVTRSGPSGSKSHVICTWTARSVRARSLTVPSTVRG